MASVRNRLFFVIAGMALLAALSIGAAYLATEPERLDVRNETRVVADLYALSVRLSNAIRGQEAAIDDYLLVGKGGTASRYSAAVETELQLMERMRLEAVKYPGVGGALEALAADTRAWGAGFAEPAIAAIESGSKADVARIETLVAVDQEPTVRTVAALVSPRWRSPSGSEVARRAR